MIDISEIEFDAPARVHDVYLFGKFWDFGTSLQWNLLQISHLNTKFLMQVNKQIPEKKKTKQKSSLPLILLVQPIDL